MERYNNAVDISHFLLAAHVSGNDSIIDATLGNGNDTLFAASLTSGIIYGFDIQETAIRKAGMLLKEHCVPSDRIRLIHESHEAMARFVTEPVSAVLFNLGYLPGGDKTVTTMAESTIAGLNASLSLLVPGGIVIVVVYPGHLEGAAEYEAVKGFAASLPQRRYNVVHFSFPNQKGAPPELFSIESRI